MGSNSLEYSSEEINKYMDVLRKNKKDGATQKKLAIEYKVTQSTIAKWVAKAEKLIVATLPKKSKKNGNIPGQVKVPKTNVPKTDEDPPDNPKDKNTQKKFKPSPFIKDVANIQGYFAESELICSVKDAMNLRSESMRLEGMEDIPPWNVPFHIKDPVGKNLYHPKTLKRVIECTDWIDKDGNQIIDSIELKTDTSSDWDSAHLPTGLNEIKIKTRAVTKQVLIMKVICDPSYEIVGVEADKRKGKSTAAFAGVCQGHWDGIFRKTGLWASGEDNALDILNDVFHDKISTADTSPLFKGVGSDTKKVFFNNGILKAFSNNAARTSGLDFDLCWCDEAHEVIVNHSDVLAMIVMTMRSKPGIKLLLTMNMGTGAYQLFKTVMEREFGPKEWCMLTIEDGDIVHITAKADKKTRILVEALVGKDEKERWLDNKYNASGDVFDAYHVGQARIDYRTIMAIQNPVPEMKIMGIDPSDVRHPVGWAIWAANADGTLFWMISGGEIKLARNQEDLIAKGKGQGSVKWTKKRMEAFLIAEAQEQIIKMLVIESNSGGGQTRLNFIMAGIPAMPSNFGSSQKSRHSREAMIGFFKGALEAGALLYDDDLLEARLTMYDPEKKDSSTKKKQPFKGDIVDASLHAIYRLMYLTRSPFMFKKKEVEKEEITEMKMYD